MAQNLCRENTPHRAVNRLILATLLSSVALSAGAANRVPQSQPDYHLNWVWSTIGDGIGVGGLEISDLDGDGRAEILATGDVSYTGTSGGYWVRLEYAGRLIESWSSLPSEAGLRAIRAARKGIDPPLVAATASTIEVFDPQSMVLRSSFPTGLTDARALAVADLYGDGAFEAAVCDTENLYLFDLFSGTPIAVRYGFGCSDIEVAQIDADPQLELVLAGNVLGGFVLDGSTLAVDWADVRGFGRQVRVADLDDDGRDEVVSQASNYGGLRVQDPETGMTLWEDTEAYVAAIAVADVDPAKGPEVLWGPGQWGDLHVLDGATGEELWTLPNSDDGVASIATGDLDGDGLAEVVWSAGVYAGSGHLFVAGGATHAVESQSENWSRRMAGLEVVDLDADGRLEVATAASTSEYFGPGILIELSLDRGAVERSAPVSWTDSGDSDVYSLTTAQLDADPALEICVSGQIYYEGKAACYDATTFARQWLLDLPFRGASLGVGELDGDALPELILGTESAYLFAFQGETGWLDWRSPNIAYPAYPFDRFVVADVSGDGIPEIVAGHATSWDSEGQLTTFEAATGAIVAGPWEKPFVSMLSIAGADGEADQVLLGRVDGSIVPFDPWTGTEGPPVAQFPASPTVFAIADLDHDGAEDFVALGDGYLRVVDGASGLVAWTSPYLGYAPGDSAALRVGDFDDDGLVEMAVTTEVGIAVFAGPVIHLFSDGFESGDTSSWSEVSG